MLKCCSLKILDKFKKEHNFVAHFVKFKHVFKLITHKPFAFCNLKIKCKVISIKKKEKKQKL